jgi:glutamate-1-semialdehyde 2,1-aminomutase
MSRYRSSEEMLDRALQTIPLGSQTFSKSKTQFPRGVSPFFIQKGRGSRVWDVDGNEYVDFINGLASLTLGYNDPDVTNAVKCQMEDGVIFSLPHPLEIQVAEKIVEMVPCAEMVRFAKNGSDATAGAIRIARAFTNRDHVAVCGYHGWQDWYIGSTPRNRGVPKATQALTHAFAYNDLDSLSKILWEHPDQVAAVIMEPMNATEPAAGFLEGVKETAHHHGALLIFDETITGFRFSNGGAQELFGITPDLATFGKGLANGYPLSAVAGRAEVMKLMEEVFFSFTFGGEALSLAASLATMKKLKEQPVVRTLWRQGEKVATRLRELIQENGLEGVLRVSGKPCWSFFVIQDSKYADASALKTLFLQEMFSRGILTIGTHNMSFAHSDADITLLMNAYGEVLSILKRAVDGEPLSDLLKCRPLEPLFKIR